METRWGILGGSFNPVHGGHLLLAQDALEAFGLERVLWVPCGQAPHKAAGQLAPAADRLAMLKLAIGGDPRFEVSTVELDRPGLSYAIDTVDELQRRHPGVRFSFIIGADTLPELKTWENSPGLLERCDFVTLGRPGFAPARMSDAEIGLPAPWPERLRARAAEGRAIGISSSEIRRRLAAGLDIRYFVPPAVEAYLRGRSLYGHRL
jgi:nicotinate-nucleotide adenylyltransferase